MRLNQAILLFIALAIAPAAFGGTVTTAATYDGTATYNGYYAWGSGASWVWFSGGSEAHYYSDCYPCYFWDNSRIFIEFALPPVTGNITGAALYLDVTAYQNYNPDAATLYHQADSSALTGNAYNDRGSLNASEFVQGVTVPELGWLVIPVTSYIASDYGNGYSYAAFAFMPTGSGYGNSLLQWSTDGGPILSITTDAVTDTPEPASISLIVLAGAGLALGRRQRWL